MPTPPLDVFPIRDEADYRRALLILELTPEGDSEVENRIEVFAQLVELWEIKHREQLPSPRPEAALRELLLLKGVSQTEIAVVLGTRPSNISAILAGKRRLNSTHVEILSRFLDVDVDVFGKVPRARFRVAQKK